MDSICCPPQVDTFLAKPQNVMFVEKPRKTLQEKKKWSKDLEDVLDAPYPNGFWENLDALEQQKTLLFLQREILEEAKSKER